MLSRVISWHPHTKNPTDIPLLTGGLPVGLFRLWGYDRKPIFQFVGTDA